tara:strand:+ start:205 stop:645 length:441 start_codon:yes stop_codon:yes gene_type:complete
MKLDILYATQTGNAEEVAQNLSSLAKNKGFIVNINEMNHYSMDQFRKLKNVAIVTSTFGEGEVPEMGIEFWKDLESSTIKISNLKYGLIALGDRSHEIFCGAGKAISKKLEELDGKKIIENLECDGDTEGTQEWSVKFLDILKSKN